MVLNRQSAVRIPLKDLNRFVSRVQRKLRIPSDAFTVCLVTNHQIGRWNRAFRGKKGATDVLSFGNTGGRGGKGSEGGRGKTSPDSRRGLQKGKTKRREGKSEPSSWRSIWQSGGFSSTSFTSFTSSTCYLGDIAIAPVVARANARRFGRTTDEELRILILHGVLHLMGYDHETDHGEMDRREQRLRRKLGLE